MDGHLITCLSDISRAVNNVETATEGSKYGVSLRGNCNSNLQIHLESITWHCKSYEIHYPLVRRCKLIFFKIFIQRGQMELRNSSTKWLWHMFQLGTSLSYIWDRGEPQFPPDWHMHFHVTLESGQEWEEQKLINCCKKMSLLLILHLMYYIDMYLEMLYFFLTPPMSPEREYNKRTSVRINLKTDFLDRESNFLKIHM